MAYQLCERGRFECSLVRDGMEVAYTDYNCVRLGIGYKECDREAVQKFADDYELEVEGRNVL